MKIPEDDLAYDANYMKIYFIEFIKGDKCHQIPVHRSVLMMYVYQEFICDNPHD